jgi:uncharacterized protein (DUF302 family)
MEVAMTEPGVGVIDVASSHSVAETIDRLEALARATGLAVFARIDFSGDASRVGLAMRPMQALIFGNPRAGTPLLVASPRSGLDLPLKALAWQDANGKVWVSLNDPEYVVKRHGLHEDLAKNIAGARAIVTKAAG